MVQFFPDTDVISAILIINLLTGEISSAAADDDDDDVSK